MASYVPPSMSTLPEPCNHKAEIGCNLTALPCCCACADKRPLAPAYPIYVDGEGMKNTGKRWQRYCWKCRDHHNHITSLESAHHNFNIETAETEITGRQDSHEMPTRSGFVANSSSRAVHATRGETQSARQSRHHAHPGPGCSQESRTTPTAGSSYATTGGPPEVAGGPSSRTTEPQRNRRPRQAFPLGTREDVEQDDYQSPLAGMFTRAWDRYRTAEEVRRAERALNPRAQAFNPNVNEVPRGLPVQANNSARVRRSSNRFHAQLYGVPDPQHVRTAASTQHAAQYPTLFFRGSSSNSDLESNHVIASSQPPPTMQANLLNPGYANPFQHHLTQIMGSEFPIPINELMQDNEDPNFDGQGPNAIDRQTRPTPLTAEEMKVDISCKICNEQKIDTLTEPCNHFVMCHWCAAAWKDDYVRRRHSNPFGHEEHRCPMCRQKIKGTRRVHIG